MPLHRHECESCGNRFRVLELPGVESGKPTCPVCGGTSTHRLMPLVAVQFKGSGFYKTDRAAKTRSRSDRSGSDAGSSSSPTAAKTSDSKGEPDGSATSGKTSSET